MEMLRSEANRYCVCRARKLLVMSDFNCPEITYNSVEVRGTQGCAAVKFCDATCFDFDINT